jgi:Bifunctional DNA primase/polymerase, N-terminal/Primase C terminal 1 (PriCT-1)
VIRSALTLARKGLHVFPCVPRSKHPAVATGLKAATIDETTIRQWWQQIPDANIGIATGTPSGVFVVDVDGIDAEGELRRLETLYGALPPTIEIITARGRHVWFKMPDTPIRNSAGKLAPGLDIRATGGYVLVPPSVHPTGRRYAWSVDCAGTIADAPSWLTERITNANGTDNGSKPPAEWRTLVQGINEGARDCSLTKLSGYLLRRHVDPFVTLELIRSFNATRCTPPLPDKDIERIVSSVAGLELKRRQASNG